MKALKTRDFEGAGSPDFSGTDGRERAVEGRAPAMRV